MMTILSQQFFLHNRYSKYQQMVCEGIIEPEKLPSVELLHGFMGCEFIFKLFSGRSLMNSLTGDETGALNVMCCTTWYHLYNFTNVKNTHGGVLVK